MGDKSPKSKDRAQKQKNTAKAGHTAKAKSKQDSQSAVLRAGAKNKK